MVVFNLVHYFVHHVSCSLVLLTSGVLAFLALLVFRRGLLLLRLVLSDHIQHAGCVGLRVCQVLLCLL